MLTLDTIGTGRIVFILQMKETTTTTTTNLVYSSSRARYTLAKYARTLVK